VAVPSPDLVTNLIVSEIHYHPLPPSTPAELAATADKNDFEFIELKNIGLAPLDLTDVGFTRGIAFSFATNAVLAPGEFLVVASHPAAFAARYGINRPVAGYYSGRLDNAGERLTLNFAGSVDLRDFAYSDSSPWPAAPDGTGPSLVLRDANSNPNPGVGANWMASTVIGGTPGYDEPASAGTYAAWVQASFAPAQQVNPAVSAATADPDGDGFDNLAEFAFAMQPLVADQPVMAFVWSANGVQTYPGLRFHRPVANGELGYELRASNDLETWTTVATQPVQSAPLGNGVEEVVFRDTQPSTAPQRFLRLRVTLVP
jgi:hypothetical protein